MRDGPRRLAARTSSELVPAFSVIEAYTVGGLRSGRSDPLLLSRQAEADANSARRACVQRNSRVEINGANQSRKSQA